MKKSIMSILILIVYSLPFSFISMYCDLKYGSMLGYIIMILSYICLPYICKITNRKNIIILGNTISLLVSYLFAISVSDERWSYYFKPLSSIQLLILIFVISVLLQLFIINLTKKK